MKALYSLACICALLLVCSFVLSSCGCHCRICNRVPCIEERRSDCVLDYDVFDEMECSPCCDCTECNPCSCCVEVLHPCEDGCVADDAFGELALSTDRYQPIIDQYIIGIGDVLEISVFGDEDTLAENVTVAPDGRIYYFFLEGLYVEGKTVEQLHDELVKNLENYFVAPSVTIIPKLIASQTYSILGQVGAPGLYPLHQTVTLRQAIATAGGVLPDKGAFGSEAIQPFNRRNRVSRFQNSFLVRNGEKLNIDVKNLIQTADFSHDITLKPGDYIYIGSEEESDVYVLGAAPGPGVVGYYDGLTLMGAITSSGGWLIGPYGADLRKVLVIRGSLHCPRVVQINICDILCGVARDLYLQPGDIVYVYEKDFGFGRELVDLAISTFVNSFFNTAGSHYADRHIFNNGRHNNNNNSNNSNGSGGGGGSSNGNGNGKIIGKG